MFSKARTRFANNSWTDFLIQKTISLHYETYFKVFQLLAKLKKNMQKYAKLVSNIAARSSCDFVRGKTICNKFCNNVALSYFFIFFDFQRLSKIFLVFRFAEFVENGIL